MYKILNCCLKKNKLLEELIPNTNEHFHVTVSPKIPI
jgi:hypothetical protein